MNTIDTIREAYVARFGHHPDADFSNETLVIYHDYYDEDQDRVAMAIATCADRLEKRGESTPWFDDPIGRQKAGLDPQP